MSLSRHERIDIIDAIARGGWFNLLLNLISGASLVLAFAPFGYWYLIFPGLIWFIFPLKTLTVRQTLFRSLTFHTGFFAAGISWIHVSIYQFSFTPFLLSLTMTALLVLFLSFLASITLMLLNRFASNLGISSYYSLALPVAWIGSEWFFNWVFTGFPWMSLGYSQIDSFLSSLAPVLGVASISFLLIFISGVLVTFIRGGFKKANFALASVILIVAVVVGLNQIQWLQETTKIMEVSLIQPNISQHKKWLPEQRRETLDYFYETTDTLDSKLVIWPEGAVPALVRNVANYLSLIDAMAWNKHQAVLTGIASEEDGRYYNTALILGNGAGKYYKQHLVPFGEYVPLESVLRGLIGIFDLPMSSFSKGPKTQALLQTGDWNIAMALCYEIIFQDVIHNQIQDADLMITLSNDAWFGDSLGPYQHLSIARMRALENGIPIIRATNDGISAFIDHKGRVTSKLGKFKKAVLTADITAVSGVTPYRQLGPLWSYVIILVIPVFLLLIGLYRRRN